MSNWLIIKKVKLKKTSSDNASGTSKFNFLTSLNIERVLVSKSFKSVLFKNDVCDVSFRTFKASVENIFLLND